MHFSIDDLWCADGPPSRQAVVVNALAEGRRGLLLFQDTLGKEWFSSSRIAKEDKWRLGKIKDRRPVAEVTLRALLLNIIYDHPVCPGDYLINIVTCGTQGDWSIEHVTPSDRPGYSDCTKYAAS